MPPETPCSFCGDAMVARADGQKARTEEHCFPKWLAKMIPDASGTTWDHTVRDAKTGAVVRSWSTRDLSVTSRKVCRDCNTGWMKKLEDAAAPVLLPLLRGERCTIGHEGAAVLAAWAIKTNLALFLANPVEGPPLPVSLYRNAARAAGNPPEHVQVFVGAYSGPRDFFHLPRRLHGLPQEAHGYVATMIVGKAVFHVFGHDHADPLTLDLAPARLEATPRLWPDAPPLDWPPRALDERRFWQYVG